MKMLFFVPGNSSWSWDDSSLFHELHIWLPLVPIQLYMYLYNIVLLQINDIVAEFEQEKFEMQKQHTKSIQEILDDTNARLQKMEKEYSQQTLSTVGYHKLYSYLQIFFNQMYWCFCYFSTKTYVVGTH